jgi:glucokinase
MQKITIIENERKIITLARDRGFVSKPAICSEGGLNCGWATATKLVNRLVKNRILVDAGTMERNSRYGKNAKILTLTKVEYLCIGIDVEKTFTTYAIMTLKGDILKKVQIPTPRSFPDSNAVAGFLCRTIRDFLMSSEIRKTAINAIGIGIPYYASENWITPDYYQTINTAVQKQIGIPCYVANNIACFCNYYRLAEKRNNFYLISLRTGIGGGLVVDNKLFSGQGNAGEIGHIYVGGSKECDCGKRGCLQAEASAQSICKYYSSLSSIKTDNIVHVFQRACNGEKHAVDAVDHLALHLANTIMNLQNILDLPEFIVCSQLGEYGAYLISRIHLKLKYFHKKVEYYDFKPLDFLNASAFLAQKSFYN